MGSFRIGWQRVKEAFDLWTSKPHRRLRYFSIAGVVAVFLVWSAVVYVVHWGDPDKEAKIVNFIANVIPTVLGIIAAFIPDMERAKRMRPIWRVGIVLIGIGWSVVLWRQQSLSLTQARKDQAKLIEHTDASVKGVKESIDNLGVGEMKQSIAALTEMASQRTFLYFQVLPTKPPGPDGSVTIPFMVHNRSVVSSGPYNIFIRICDKCRFKIEPLGFQNVSGPEAKDRVAHIEYALDAFMHTGTMELHIFPPPNNARYRVMFYYSCASCFPGSALQPYWQQVYFPPYLAREKHENRTRPPGD